MSSIQIIPPVDIPEELARFLDDRLWDRCEAVRVATNPGKDISVAVEKVDAGPGYVVRTPGETTWFSDENEADLHYLWLIKGTELSEHNV